MYTLKAHRRTMRFMRIVARFLPYSSGKDQRSLQMEQQRDEGFHILCRTADYENCVFGFLPAASRNSQTADCLRYSCLLDNFPDSIHAVHKMDTQVFVTGK